MEAEEEHEKFNLLELRKLHQCLIENKARIHIERYEAVVVETLRSLAELTVYGDNKSELMFDFFCEKNMLSLFLELMYADYGCPSTIHVQILQTLSIVINCVRNHTSLYYLLSNNYINRILLFQHDFDTCEEALRDQFLSFMKSMSLKLNTQTIQFFFMEDGSGRFPLLQRAIELMYLPEAMGRIATQSTILNVYKVKDKQAREYALEEGVMLCFFREVVKLMDKQYMDILQTCNTYLAACDEGDAALLQRCEHALDDILNTTEDWFYYLQDLLDLQIPRLRTALVTHIMDEFFVTVLMNPVRT
jgi:protein CLEC16A